MEKFNFINDKSPFLGIGIFLLVLTIGNLFLLWMLREEPQSEKRIPTAAFIKPSEPPNQPINNGEVTRKSHLDPGRTFTVNVFYQNDQEIARYKSSNDQVFDMTGEIPNGEIKCVNESTGTYGEAHYLYGKRHGLFQEYYPNGQLKKETFYSFGQVLTNKEFFIDGILRMEEDYTDALQLIDVKEVGVGKVYNRKGIIKYEWNLTRGNPHRFNKAYNANGEWLQINYFDEGGKLIKTEKNTPSEGESNSSSPFLSPSGGEKGGRDGRK